ncbi:hypothetical protein ACTGZQ_08290 [Streptococcus suis]
MIVGAPVGHPFFGNQYTDGGYQQGSFTYTSEPFIGTVRSIVEESISSSTNAQDCSGSNKDKRDIILGLFAIASVVSIGSYFAYRYFNRKKTGYLELDNVGVCKNCNEPLSGSTYHPKDEKHEVEAFIQCQYCEYKNFAQYSIDELTEN